MRQDDELSKRRCGTSFVAEVSGGRKAGNRQTGECVQVETCTFSTLKPKQPSPRNHCSVVRRQPRRRCEYSSTNIGGSLAHCAYERGIARDPSAQHDSRATKCVRCAIRF